MSTLNNSKREGFFRSGNHNSELNSPTHHYKPGDFSYHKSSSTDMSTRNMSSNQKNLMAGGDIGANLVKTTSDANYVGFATLPNQVYRKSVKKGFEFNLMVVGESGLGKSTLLNSMFNTNIYDLNGKEKRKLLRTVMVETNKVVLKEKGVQLKLNVVDTPGFGDLVDNSKSTDPIIEYINDKFNDYLQLESRVNRPKLIPDNRIHCLLYFISPNGYGLKEIDVHFMKKLHDKVNIIPIIAKADTLTFDECEQFKKTIRSEIAQYSIRVYDFPDVDDEEYPDQKLFKKRLPFAVIGSNAIIEKPDGKKIRGRKYPWGIVEVENLQHNDFIALRNMIIRMHMHDLKDVTNNVHYENFRFSNLSIKSKNGGKLATNQISSPLSQMEDEKRDHDAKIKKMEREMETVFQNKVKEKTQKIQESEQQMLKKAEEMKKTIQEERNKLREERERFEQEKSDWEQDHSNEKKGRKMF